jgi:transposase
MGADIPESTLVGWVNAGSRSDRLSGGQSEVRTGRAPGGRSMKTLSPLIERIEADIMGSDLLHAPSRAYKHALPSSGRYANPGAGSLLTRQGAWQRGQTRPDLGLCARSTVRHVASIGSRANGGRAGTAPPGAVYRFAPNWKEEHVLSHLVNARGILQSPLGTSRCDALPGNGWLQRLCQTLRS